MKDHILAGKHEETGKWHGLFYRNHPTPSGSPRPMLSLSTKIGFDTAGDAVSAMKMAFTEEQLKDIEVPEESK